MAIGKRIRFFRNLRGMKQKQLGEALGFTAKTSEVRITQYESEARIPKDDLIKQIAAILDVRTEAIKVPDIDTIIGLMHTFFTLEDTYGLTIDRIDDVICLRIDRKQAKPGSSIESHLYDWYEIAARFRNGTITKEEYDDWRYHYPEKNTWHRWAKEPSQELMDMIFKDQK